MKKGFTLIELLVVITIIGILAGIVLVSLGPARSRAKDARIIADMGQIRSAAEIFYNINNTYSGFCTSSDVVTLQGDITTNGGTSFGCNEEPNNGSSYCVEVKLNSGKYWCVDSTLKSKQYGNDPACANNNYSCE